MKTLILAGAVIACAAGFVSAQDKGGAGLPAIAIQKGVTCTLTSFSADDDSQPVTSKSLLDSTSSGVLKVKKDNYTGTAYVQNGVIGSITLGESHCKFLVTAQATSLNPSSTLETTLNFDGALLNLKCKLEAGVAATPAQ